MAADSVAVATETGLKRKLLAEKCSIEETEVSLRVQCPDSEFVSLPRGLIDGQGYSLEQIMTIELVLARHRVDLLPLDW